MDDQADIREYGNHGLAEEIGGRAVVSFALFGFNQQEFVREAIESAFSQSYSPLEIILTDDCSTDATPEIMEEMAAAYQGPHKIIVRKGLTNIGTLSHVLQAARLAKGDIFVVAAGDDISLSERVGFIVKRMRDSDCTAFSSDDFAIASDGQETPQPEYVFTQRAAKHKLKPAWIHGATAAYRRSFLTMLDLPDQPVLFEDIVFTDLMQILGLHSIRSDAKLIKYRKHTSNLFNSSLKSAEFSKKEEILIKEWTRIHFAKTYVLNSIKKISGHNKIIQSELSRIEIEEIFFREMSNWRSSGIQSRMIRTIAALKIQEYRRSAVTVSLERAFGETAFRQYSNIRHALKGLFRSAFPARND